MPIFSSPLFTGALSDPDVSVTLGALGVCLAFVLIGALIARQVNRGAGRPAAPQPDQAELHQDASLYSSAH